MSRGFILAHLSDPHLGPLPRPRLRDLANKRAIGYANWRRGRDEVHLLDVLDALVCDLRTHEPDHVALTGDLMNIGLRSEVPSSLEWLTALGADDWVSLVPGNHDAYVRGSLERAQGAWNAYMASDKAHATGHERDPPRFPYVRRRGLAALVGVSTAIATAPFLSTGKVGTAQRRRLEERLHHLEQEGLFRIVMLHHPPVIGATSWHKRLTDAEQFASVIRRAGAELIVHGHTHLPSVAWLAGPHHPVPVVGVPSASAAAATGKSPAGYNLYEIGGVPGDWRCDLTMHALSRGDRDFAVRSRMTLLGENSLGRAILASSPASR